MKVKLWYTRATDTISYLLEVTVCFLFLASVLIGSYEVVMRYVFASPHDWGEEVILTTMLYALFLAAILALREGKLTYIGIVPARLAPRSRIAWQIFLTIVTIITCAAYGWSAVELVGTLKGYGLTSATSLAMPYWIRYLVLPISLWLCALVSVESLVKMTSELVSYRRK